MATRSSSPIHLTILRRGDTNIIDLDEVDSLIPRSETQVDGTFLQEIVTEVMRLTTLGQTRGAAADAPLTSGQSFSSLSKDLERIGGLIFSHLLTDLARKRLRTASSCSLYLRLDEQLIHLPWELCHDGNDFLATKFSVGRQVITGYPLPTPTPRREPREGLRVLLIVDPTETLTEAVAEAEQLSTLLDEVPGVEVTFLGGKGARKVPILTALQDHDIVHFAGHSHYDAATPSQSGWRLHEGILTAGELSKLTYPPLLVFSNSCQAGTTSEWSNNRHYEGQAFGIGSAFLLAGVRNYIGTFWVVHDEESVLFATAFYRGVVAGLNLGDALLNARHETIKQRGWERLSWASYMLYGDPAFPLLSLENHQPQKKTPEEKGEAKGSPRSFSIDAAKAPQAQPVTFSYRRRITKITLIIASIILVGVLAFFLRSDFLLQKSLSSLNETYEQAFAQLKAGQRERAFALFQRLLTAPTNTIGLGYDGMAAIYFEEGRLPEAKEASQKSLASSRPSPIALVIQGDIAFSLGDWKTARALYHQATQAEAQHGWPRAIAYNALGVVSALTGMEGEARKYFYSALQADETSIEAYLNLGCLFWKDDKLSEAEQMFHKGLNLQPGDEQLHLLLEIIAAQRSSSPLTSTEKKIVVAPFDVGGGNIRRLGMGEAFAWLLTRQIPGAGYGAESRRVETRPALSEPLSQEQIRPEHLAQEKKAHFTISGEIQVFSRKIIVHGQVAAVDDEILKRTSYVSDEEGGSLASASRALAEKLTQMIDEQGGK